MMVEYQELKEELTELVEELNQECPPKTGHYILKGIDTGEDVFFWILREFPAKLFGLIPYTKKRDLLAEIAFYPDDGKIIGSYIDTSIEAGKELIKFLESYAKIRGYKYRIEI